MDLTAIINDIIRLKELTIPEIVDLDGFINQFESNVVRQYLRELPESEPESELRATLLNRECPLFKYIFGEKILTEAHSNNDNRRSIDNVAEFENNGRIGIEIKPFLDKRINPRTHSITFFKKDLSVISQNQDVKTQIKKYLFSTNLAKEYIVLTNLSDFYFYSKSSVLLQDEKECKPFAMKTFNEFINEFTEIDFLPNYIERLEERLPKKDLDEIFFIDLKIWVNKILSLKFNPLVSDNRKLSFATNLINKFIFIQTLDLFWIIEREKLIKIWNSYRDYQNRKFEYIKRFFTEVFRFFWDFYDTDFFSEAKESEKGVEDYLSIIYSSTDNIELFFKILTEILGITEGIINRGILQYDFRKINADIFGKAYENFLADRRREQGIYYTPPYITKYISEITVGNIFDDLIDKIIKSVEERKFSEVEEITKRIIATKVIDPACGSGSFLIKVFRIIYEKYMRLYGYIKPYMISLTRGVFPNVVSIWNLLGFDKYTLDKKLFLMRIVLLHIFGNDLDNNAIEVAKLNLLIEIVKTEPKLYKPVNIKVNHILPSLKLNLTNSNFLVSINQEDLLSFLENNFKNSIKNMFISYYSYLSNPYDISFIDSITKIQNDIIVKIRNQYGLVINDENNLDIIPFFYPLFFWFNYFDANGNRKDLEQRGFDVVLGNPPYINLRNLNENYKTKIDTYLNQFVVHNGYNDIFYYFIERGINILKSNSLLSYITTDYFYQNTYSKNIRDYICNQTLINKIIDFKNFKIFPQGIHTTIIKLSKKENVNSRNVLTDNYIDITLVNQFEKSGNELIDHIRSKQTNSNEIVMYTKKQAEFCSTNYWVLSSINDELIRNKIKEICIPNGSTNPFYLSNICDIEKGSSTGKNTVFIIDSNLIAQENIEMNLLKKYLRNSDIDRYCIDFNELYLIYVTNPNDLANYPQLNRYLLRHQQELEDRNEVKKGLYHWTRLERPRDENFYESSEKIITPYRSSYNKFAYDNNKHFGGSDTYHIVKKTGFDSISLFYILAILNSKLINYYYTFIGKPKGNILEYFVDPLSEIPIKIPNLNDENEKQIYESIVDYSYKFVSFKEIELLILKKFQTLRQNYRFNEEISFLDIYDNYSNLFQIDRSKTILSPRFNDSGIVTSINCLSDSNFLILRISTEENTQQIELAKIWINDIIILLFLVHSIKIFILLTNKKKFSNEILSECLDSIILLFRNRNMNENINSLNDLMNDLDRYYQERIQQYNENLKKAFPLNHVQIQSAMSNLDNLIDEKIFELYKINLKEIYQINDRLTIN